MDSSPNHLLIPYIKNSVCHTTGKHA